MAKTMTPRNLPTALVVGPMKCGTSWIHDYLAARGDVCLPHLVKETFYFDRFHDRGLDWYAERFAHADPARHRAIIEVAPSYFHRSEDIPGWIREELGDIPILITLRDPVERTWSHYQHLRRGYTKESLEEAAVSFPEILEASRYDQHLARWQAQFSRVSIVEQSVLKSEPLEYAAHVARSLGLEATGDGVIPTKKANQATKPRSFVLARLGRLASHGLRKIGLYRFVDYAKRLGLKRLFFGTSRSQQPKLSEAERAFIRSALQLDSQQV